MTKVCEVCGNEYDKVIEVRMNGESHFFDSFECAVHKLAVACAHCGCRILGHGVEGGGKIFCCAHCAHKKGQMSIKDRAA
jgi:hypothetical protein